MKESCKCRHGGWPVWRRGNTRYSRHLRLVSRGCLGESQHKQFRVLIRFSYALASAPVLLSVITLSKMQSCSDGVLHPDGISAHGGQDADMTHYTLRASCSNLVQSTRASASGRLVVRTIFSDSIGTQTTRDVS